MEKKVRVSIISIVTAMILIILVIGISVLVYFVQYIKAKNNKPCLYQGVFYGEGRLIYSDQGKSDVVVEGTLELKEISKEEFDLANGINVIEDVSKHRVHDYYSVKLTITANGERIQAQYINLKRAPDYFFIYYDDNNSHIMPMDNQESASWQWEYFDSEINGTYLLEILITGE